MTRVAGVLSAAFCLLFTCHVWAEQQGELSDADQVVRQAD